MKNRIRILLAGFVALYAIMCGAAIKGMAVAMEEPARETPEVTMVTEPMMRSMNGSNFAVDPAATEPAPAVTQVGQMSQFLSVNERIEAQEQEREREYRELIEQRDRERKEMGLVVLEDGAVLYLTLDDIKAHIDQYYSNEEIEAVAHMVAGENGDYKSETIWSAHVWSVLNRLGKKGFSDSDSILGIIYSGAYDAVTLYPSNMTKPVREDIRAIVVDVFARKTYEDMGAPPERVGRTLPDSFCFFRNEGFRDIKNHFYDDWRGGNEYDPFGAPYNPYDT